MIWQNDSHGDDGARVRIADGLLRKVPAFCGKPELAHSATVTEAAMGVAAFLDQQGGAPDLPASCALMSRALEASGNPALARRVGLFGEELVHSATWITAGAETVWVLDVGRLIRPPDACIEIALFERVRSTLAAFADVWDATGGRGMLGLKGLPRAAAQVLGPEARPTLLRRFAAELHDFCGVHLARLRADRSWERTPAVISLL